MADEPRQQPVAIRVTRPYPTADEFLEHELETLTRTSITLLGAQPRPKGVILRFEVALASGGQLLRGEGRVVGFKENALGDQPGLVLRFTRLDTKSKALVDKAAAIREARARAALQAAMGEDSLAPPPSFAPSSMAPNSIGPMSVAQEPPSRPAMPSLASSPPTRPAPITAPPAFFTQSQSGEAPEAPPPPTPASFDDAMFSASEDAPTAAETSSSPKLFDTGGSLPPAVPQPSAPAPAPVAPPPAASSRPSSPKVAPPAAPSSGSLRAAATAVVAPPPAPSSASSLSSGRPRSEREPLLERLRDRAKGLSPERLGALLRR